jgi:hypothetical protein
MSQALFTGDIFFQRDALDDSRGLRRVFSIKSLEADAEFRKRLFLDHRSDFLGETVA